MSKQDFKFNLPWTQTKTGRDLMNLDGSPYYFTQRFREGIWRNAAQAATSHRTVKGVAAVFGIAATVTCVNAHFHPIHWESLTISFAVASIFIGINVKRHANYTKKLICEFYPELADAVIDKSGYIAASDNSKSIVVGGLIRGQTAQHLAMKIIANPILRTLVAICLPLTIYTAPFLIFGSAVAAVSQAFDGKQLLTGKYTLVTNPPKLPVRKKVARGAVKTILGR